MKGNLTLWSCSMCGQLNSTLGGLGMHRYSCEVCRTIFDKIEKI